MQVFASNQYLFKILKQTQFSYQFPTKIHNMATSKHTLKPNSRNIFALNYMLQSHQMLKTFKTPTTNSFATNKNSNTAQILSLKTLLTANNCAIMLS